MHFSMLSFRYCGWTNKLYPFLFITIYCRILSSIVFLIEFRPMKSDQNQELLRHLNTVSASTSPRVWCVWPRRRTSSCLCGKCRARKSFICRSSYQIVSEFAETWMSLCVLNTCMYDCMSNLILWTLSYGLLDSPNSPITRIPTQFTGLAIRQFEKFLGVRPPYIRYTCYRRNVQFSFLLEIEIAENLFPPSRELSLFMLFIVLTRPCTLAKYTHIRTRLSLPPFCAS